MWLFDVRLQVQCYKYDGWNYVIVEYIKIVDNQTSFSLKTSAILEKEKTNGDMMEQTWIKQMYHQDIYMRAWRIDKHQRVVDGISEEE